MNRKNTRGGQLAERRRRGWLMVIIGAILMLTRLAGLDAVFAWSGIMFAALGLGDIFFSKRYRRRF